MKYGNRDNPEQTSIFWNGQQDYYQYSIECENKRSWDELRLPINPLVLVPVKWSPADTSV